MIELQHLRKEYPNAVPLKDVSVTIRDGDIVSVIGPSGTGKSTLIRCIDLLDKPSSGRILIDGKDITAKGCDIREVRKKVGMVFQSFNLFGHQTVIENVMNAPILLSGLSRQEAYGRAMKLLRMVGMEGRALHYPDMLSGGQKQRVAIARTLSMDPDIVLFDEPTSALDPTMVGEVEAVIRELAKTGKTMMIVTHEMRFAREISNRVFYMDEGGIYEDGTPEQIFDHPQRERTRRFVRQLKLKELRITPEDFDPLRCANELNLYLLKNEVPVRMRYLIESVFEELCFQILKPALSQPQINFVLEYDEAGEKTFINVLYNGKPFDPRESANDIALSILQANAVIESYTPIDEPPYTNKLTLTVGRNDPPRGAQGAGEEGLE